MHSQIRGLHLRLNHQRHIRTTTNAHHPAQMRLVYRTCTSRVFTIYNIQSPCCTCSEFICLRMMRKSFLRVCLTDCLCLPRLDFSELCGKMRLGEHLLQHDEAPLELARTKGNTNYQRVLQGTFMGRAMRLNHGNGHGLGG